jgi:hypothetical protein
MVEVKKSTRAGPYQVTRKFSQRTHRATHQHSTHAAHPSHHLMSTSSHKAAHAAPDACQLVHSTQFTTALHPIAAKGTPLLLPLLRP